MTHRLKKAVKESLLPSSLFENMGFTYLGPVNGHDLRELTEILRYARDLKEPVLLHVRTIKGKDFTPAEENPDAYHGVSPFDPETGEPLKQGRASFSSVFGREVARLARERGLNVWAYTGYTYKRLLAGEVPDALALLEQVDVLVDGPFVEAEKSYAALFRGSANQRLIDVPKSLAAGAVVLWERPDPLAHFTRPEA